MCDEVSDRANTDSGSVREAVVGLIEVRNTTSGNLHDVVVSKLERLRLPLNLLVGQCYDGAANMSGQYNGLQARLKDTCPRKPVYVHSWAHVLNFFYRTP